ncbi:restriction endonuclease [Candidatus Woesearchaeota archaeon]|nr:restriction endonuclease [Candidatus Woesearchaeota archaeon]
MGTAFEKWTADLYDELGKLNVKRDVKLNKHTRHGDARSQIDVTYGLRDKRYVECKYHDGNDNVTLEEVAKFAGVLRINGIDYDQGIMITNKDYLARAKEYARKMGVKLIDREQLVKLDWKRTHQLRALVQAPPKGFERTLEQRIKRYAQ